MSSEIGATDGPRLLLVGASTRAAACSARRAGFRPICCDLFADADTQAIAETRQVHDYPRGVLSLLPELPAAPVVYVGALENEPDILRAIAGRQPLFGNPAEIIDTVRDPLQLVQGLASIRQPHLAVRGREDPPPRDGTWVIKPVRTAAGRRIAVWDESAAPRNERHYFQQRAVGDAYSAVFVAPPDRSDVRFVGITRQVIGATELNAPPFAWCGSVGPVALTVHQEQTVRRIGNFLSWQYGLCGLFGLDFIVDERGVPRITEVNPRYPASTEVLEHACGVALLRDHCAAFGMEPPAPVTPVRAAVAALGKFVLYSDRDFQAPSPRDWLDPAEWLHERLWADVPHLADIPRAGACLRAGHPVCTFFVTGPNAEACLSELPAAAARLRERLSAIQLENRRDEA